MLTRRVRYSCLPRLFLSVLFVAVTVSLPSGVSTSTTCAHRAPVASEIKRARTTGSGTHSAAKRQSHSSIRISTIYDSSIDWLPTAQQDLIRNDVVPEVVQLFSSALSVVPVSGRILLSRDCASRTLFNPDRSVVDTFCEGACEYSTTCGTIRVPQQHLTACQECRFGRNCQETTAAGAGVEADFVLYIGAINAGPCSSTSSTIAFANVCQIDRATDRPLAGYANLCPSKLESNKFNLKEVLVHELLHALAFSSGLFSLWRFPNGTERTARGEQGFPPIVNRRFVADSNTVTTVSVTRETINGPRTHEVTYLVTEAVKREVRAHFGCPTLIGGEIENQGASGTVGSHWEKRIFENEGMTGVLTQNPAFSRITLAALEDSGWYMVNYAYAMPFRFGQGLGCDFTDNSCYGWWNGRFSPLPYCTVQPPAGSTGRTDCTPDYFSVGNCSLITYNGDIPEQYRYFSNNSQGGRVQAADFCPFYREITFTGGRRTGCALGANQPTSMDSNHYAETYGHTSRCFRHGTTQGWTVNGRSFTGGSGCYKYTCSPSSGVTLFVLGQEFACDFEGKEISIDITSGGFRYRGSLICPSCQDLCWDNTALCPAVEEPQPTTSAEEPQPTTSVEDPQPTTSVEEPQPTTSVEEPQPTTSVEEPQPTTSVEDPQPTTSVEEPQPTTSVEEPQPTTSVEEPQPTTSVEEPQPTTSVEEPQPTTSVEEPQPTTSVEEPQPTTSVEEPQPTTSVEEPQPTTSVEEPQPTTSVEDPQPTLSPVAPSSTPDPFCPMFQEDIAEVGNFTWPRRDAEGWVTITCPCDNPDIDKIPVTKYCSSDGTWQDTNAGACIQLGLDKICEKTTEEIIEALDEMVSQADTADKLSVAAGLITSVGSNVTNMNRGDYYRALSNILEADASLVEEADTKGQNIPNLVLDSIDEAPGLMDGDSIILPNLIIQKMAVVPNSMAVVGASSAGAKFTLPPAVINQCPDNDKSVISFSLLRTTIFATGVNVSSPVSGISLCGGVSNLVEPATVSFENVPTAAPGMINNCGFWDPALRGGQGGFSSSGIETLFESEGQIFCHTSHFTAFAIYQVPDDGSATTGPEGLTGGAIAGIAAGIVGFVLVLAAVAVLIFLIVQGRRVGKHSVDQAMSPQAEKPFQETETHGNEYALAMTFN